MFYVGNDDSDQGRLEQLLRCIYFRLASLTSHIETNRILCKVVVNNTYIHRTYYYYYYVTV